MVWLRNVWSARKGTRQYRVLLIAGGVNHTLSIHQCSRLPVYAGGEAAVRFSSRVFNSTSKD